MTTHCTGRGLLKLVSEIVASTAFARRIRSLGKLTEDAILKSELEIVPYDPRWPSAFEAEAVRLRNTLGALALRIDHNGSTAIPGLAAKPIIDIQVSVTALQPMAPYETPLRTIGYVHVPDYDDSFCPFFPIFSIVTPNPATQWLRPRLHHRKMVVVESCRENKSD